MENKNNNKENNVMSVEEFNQLSIAEQRVLVAKDVLAQLYAEVYKAGKGNYVSEIEVEVADGVLDDKEDISELVGDVSARDLIINKSLKSCRVCALGGALVSVIKFKNKLTVDQLLASSGGLIASQRDYSNRVSYDLIKSIFSDKQLALIENAFEGYDYDEDTCRVSSYPLTPEEIDFCDKVYEDYDSSERMKYIFENIVRNKGTFKVEKTLPDYNKI